jgi:hypothetical protein
VVNRLTYPILPGETRESVVDRLKLVVDFRFGDDSSDPLNFFGALRAELNRTVPADCRFENRELGLSVREKINACFVVVQAALVDENNFVLIDDDALVYAVSTTQDLELP